MDAKSPWIAVVMLLVCGSDRAIASAQQAMHERTCRLPRSASWHRNTRARSTRLFLRVAEHGARGAGHRVMPSHHL